MSGFVRVPTGKLPRNICSSNLKGWSSDTTANSRAFVYVCAYMMPPSRNFKKTHSGFTCVNYSVFSFIGVNLSFLSNVNFFLLSCLVYKMRQWHACSLFITDLLVLVFFKLFADNIFRPLLLSINHRDKSGNKLLITQKCMHLLSTTQNNCIKWTIKG